MPSDGWLFRRYKSLLGNSTPHPEKWGNSYFYPIGMTGNLFESEGDFLKDFLEVPEVNAVINAKARAEASGKMELISDATGKPVTNNEPLVRILRQPNWFQGQQEFWKQSSLWRSIFGNEYIFFLIPIGMTKNYKGMYTLDPSRVKIKYKSDTPYFLTDSDEAVEYYYKVSDNKYLPIQKENLIHLNDNRVSSEWQTQTGKNSGEFLKGTSMIESLQAPIKNIRAAYKKRNIALNMPIGVMSNGSKDDIGMAVPMNQAEKDRTQLQLKRHGALPIITNLAVQYNKMDINADSMGLFKEISTDMGKICDAFGVPFEIFANERGVTYANLKEAKKQMYEETVIPNVAEKMNAINNRLRLNERSYSVVTTWDHLPVFSDNVKEWAQSLNMSVSGLDKAFNSGAITLEQYTQVLNERFNLNGTN